MNWRELSKGEAQIYHSEYILDKEEITPGFDDISYQNIRIELNRMFRQSLLDVNLKEGELLNNKNVAYSFDLAFGLRLFEFFSNGEYAMNEREASNDSIWRYIQIEVIPDLIAFRWGKNNIDRYYSVSRRLYLKVLWWYIFLSWTGDIDETREILEDNTTDTIAQLVERSGLNGYKVELYRSIMKQKYEKNINPIEFRKLLVLNSARSKVVNPYLVKGGIEGYVEKLVQEIRGE